jgi:predicted RNA methylase
VRKALVGLEGGSGGNVREDYRTIHSNAGRSSTRMLTIANIRPGEIVYDLGAGDGRIIAAAARDFNAKAVGVELQDSRYQLISERIHLEGLDKLASAVKGDFLDVDLSNANVVTLYLLNSVNSMIT